MCIYHTYAHANDATILIKDQEWRDLPTFPDKDRVRTLQDADKTSQKM